MKGSIRYEVIQDKDTLKDFVCIETPIVSPYQIFKSVKMQNENRKKEKK